MNRNKIKAYAPQARRDFIGRSPTVRPCTGFTKEKTEPVVERGDVAVIGGKTVSRTVAALRKRVGRAGWSRGLRSRLGGDGLHMVQPLVAIRYMELHGYLDHGFRVFEPSGRTSTPQILEHAEEIDLAGLKRETVIRLELAGNGKPSCTASS